MKGMSYNELMQNIVSAQFQTIGYKYWNQQYYGFTIYLNNIKIDIEPIIVELKEKGIEVPLNYILEQSKINIKEALEFEDTIFDNFDLGQDDERKEKVLEYISTKKYE